MEKDPQKVYHDLVAGYEQQLEKLNRKIRRVSLLRITVFLGGIVLIYISATVSALLVSAVAVAFAVSFVLIVIRHSRLHNKKSAVERLLDINRNELLAQNRKFDSFDGGEEFCEMDHPYAEDLDVFGQGSIFQYLNRSATLSGKNKLAGWFLHAGRSVAEIRQRQEAATDLKDDLEWRQQFQSVGMEISEAPDDREGLLKWAGQPPEFQKTLYRVLLWAVPFLSTAMLALLITGVVSFQVFTLYLLLPLGFAFGNSRRVMASHALVSRKVQVIKKFSRLMRLIEEGEFSSDVLKGLQRDLTRTHHSSEAVKKLSKIIEAFDSRLNIFGWFLLNYFLLWDILQSRRLDRWRQTYRDHIGGWFEIISEFDALNSLAAFSFNHPGFVFPDPVEQAFVLKGEGCGHPLIDPQVRVDNPVRFDGWKQYIIITGANMAGKSTYLRTVAVNFLLAMAGAPVCAQQFVFSPAQLFTSIRTRDNLLQSESYFFAELKRLKAIIDRLEKGEQLFIVLDEILKGTNSKDKQSGSKALLRQLIRYSSSGLIATHDLSLGALAGEYPANIRNMRFEVEIENNELIFDYKLKQGVSQNLNATFLMKKMGITV